MDPPSSPGHNGPFDTPQSHEAQNQQDLRPSSLPQGHFVPAQLPQAQGRLNQSASPERNAPTDPVQSPPAHRQSGQSPLSPGHIAPVDLVQSLPDQDQPDQLVLPECKTPADPGQFPSGQGEPNQPPSSPDHNAPADFAQSPQVPPNLPSPDFSYCIRDSLSPEIHPMVNVKVNRPRSFAAENRFYDIQQQHNKIPSSPAAPLPSPIILPLPPLPDPLPSYKHPRDEYDSDPETPTYGNQDKENNRESKRRELSAPAVASSPTVTTPPPKPRYAIARRRWNQKYALLPWSPLALGFASISGMSPFSCFPRSRYLRRATGTRALSPSPLMLPNPSHLSPEHPSSLLTTTTIPLQSVLSPTGSAFESVVQPPDIAVPLHGHSCGRHQMSLPQSVPQLPVHQQPPSPPPVSVPGLMGPPPLPTRNRQNIQDQAWAHAKAQAHALTKARAQAQELAQAQEAPPTPPTLPSRLTRFLKSHGGGYDAGKLRVFIRIRESTGAENLYSILAEFSDEQGLEGVKRLDITLDWAWTKEDLERLAAAVRGCRFNTLTINGGNNRRQLHRRAANKAAATTPAATLFDPLIQLFGFRPLTRIHFENMPDCLQEFSVDFPADLSHLEVLQVHLDIFNWDYPPGQTFFRLARRLSHIKLLIVECPLQDYRAYLMNIWIGLMAPSAASVDTFSTKPPSQDIQVRLLSRGMAHATAFFRRQGAVPESLIVDLGFVDKYEVTWEYLLNNSIAENIHTFRLNRAPTEKWFPFVLKWLTSRQQQPSSLSPTSSTSTELTPVTTTTTCASTDIYKNTVTEYVRLQEVSLCCSRLHADSEHDLIELIKLATSPTLDLQRLHLIELRLPLDSPDIHSFDNQNGGRTTWSGLFINYNLWNLEELVIKDSNFGDIHIEGFLFFMTNMKKLEEDEKKKRWAREERRRQLELGLITLEDGELEEEDDDSDIVRMRLKVVRFKIHRLTPEAESYMMERLRDIDSSIQVFLLNK